MTTAAIDGSGGERNGRGRLKGRSPLEIVRNSGLPAELGDRVLAVTGKTRLWPWERAEVARELCGHFLDGLQSGSTCEELAETFGDARSTARLITRAKKRNRPWAWRAMKRSVQGVGVLLLLLAAWYGWNAVRYYSGTPTIKLNIQAEMNAPSLAVPLEQRGWPHYRDAARELNAAKFNTTVGSLEGWPVLAPGSKEWDAACTATDAVRPAIEKIARGASMARSACVISSAPASEADTVAPNGEWADPNQNPMGLGVLLPQLSVYRQHARLLCFEAARAAHDGRAADATARIEQMLSLARHASEDGTLIAQLVSVAIAHMTFDTINRTVRDYPALFTDEQMLTLAHRVSAFAPSAEGSTQWHPNLALERRAFEDVLQRFFTDDGNGDGRLCDGMMYYHSEFGAIEPKAAKFFNPVLAGVVAGRKETAALYNKFMDRVEAENAKPRYMRDIASLERDIAELKGGLGIRNSLVALMIPAIAKVASSFDVGRTLRDATAAGLAVELYGRRHGRFPESWSDLVPQMVPSAPQDPWSGRALGFKPGGAKGGRPLIYSIGADKTDNGGTIGTPWDVISAWSSATVPTLGGQIGTGDWVIWPKPEPAGERPPPAPVNPVGAAPAGKGYQWGWLGSLMGN